MVEMKDHEPEFEDFQENHIIKLLEAPKLEFEGV